MKKFAFILVPLMVISFLINCNSVKTFTINWKNYDGSILKTDRVNEGIMPSYEGTPTREDDDQCTYTFKGWYPEVHKADKDEDYFAQYFSIPNVYQIFWKNYDNSILKIDFVKAGETPTPPDNPSRPSNIQHNYTFKGWYPEVHKADKDETYRATYDETLVRAHITFDLNGGTSPSPIGDKYVSSIKAEDFFFDVTKDNYNFRGWTYNNQKVFDENGKAISIPLLQENMTFVATYAQDVSITIIQTVQKGEDIQISDKGGAVSGAGYYETNKDVTLSASANVGYQFDGWYINDGLVSSNLTYVHKVTKDIKITANFKPKQEKPHTLTIYTRNPSYGKVGIYNEGQATYKDSATGSFAAGDTVKIMARSDQATSFVGWYKTSDLNMVSNSQVYEFVMPDSDYSLYAVWGKEATVYEVKPEVGDEGLGTVSNKGLYFAGESATIVATPKSNVIFVGWYEDNKLLSKNTTYTYTNLSDAHYPVAKFGGYYKVSVTRSINEAGNISGDGNYYGYHNVNLIANTNMHYTFVGWYEGETLITTQFCYKFTMPNRDVNLIAKWRGTPYKVTVASSDENKGRVSGNGTYDYNSDVTITATPNNGYALQGWYEGSKLISTNPTYTFKMGGSDISLIAKFYTTKERQLDEKHGVIPVVNGNYITYGLFPQTHVNDSSLITQLDKLTPDKRGYCFYNEDYYTKVTVKPCLDHYKFDDGVPIVPGKQYWFKVEPIKWKILSNTSGQYLLTAEKALTNIRYGRYYDGKRQKTDYKGETDTVYAANYKFSELRTYLNTTFYDIAFFLSDANIKYTIVDNSAATTRSPSNPYVCPDTFDKVFALSYKDLTNANYGFVDDASRLFKTNDYSRATGTFAGMDPIRFYDCSYYSRSPCNVNTGYASIVSYDELKPGRLGEVDYGIRPAIMLTI